MIAFAHRLYALNKVRTALFFNHSGAAGYLSDLAAAPWANRVHYHFSQKETT